MPHLIKTKQDLEKFVLDKLKTPRTDQFKETFKKFIGEKPLRK